MDFNLVLSLVILVSVGILICIACASKNDYYVISYEHCLFDEYSNVQKWRVEVEYEGFFRKGTKTLYLEYRSENQSLFIKKKLEESLKNKTILKIK